MLFRSPEDAEDIAKFISSRNIGGDEKGQWFDSTPEKQALIMAVVNKAIDQGVTPDVVDAKGKKVTSLNGQPIPNIPVTKAMITQALSELKPDSWLYTADNTYADNLEKRLQKAVGTLAKDKDGKNYLPAMDDFINYRLATDRLVELPERKGSKSK